jgi:hypothetical protein
MQFSAPAAGSVLKPAEIENHLLIVEPIEYIESMPTQKGTSDAVRCTVHDITANTTHEEVLWFSTVLVGSLRSRIGAKVLGVMSKGVAKPGQSAPWILQDASSTPEAVKAAQEYLAGSTAAATPAATPTVATPEALDLAQALSMLGATPVDQPKF